MYINKQDAVSPAVSTKALLTTAVIDSKQNRNVIIWDISNGFVLIPMSKSNQKESKNKPKYKLS